MVIKSLWPMEKVISTVNHRVCFPSGDPASSKSVLYFVWCLTLFMLYNISPCGDSFSDGDYSEQVSKSECLYFGTRLQRALNLLI